MKQGGHLASIQDSAHNSYIYSSWSLPDPPYICFQWFVVSMPSESGSGPRSIPTGGCSATALPSSTRTSKVRLPLPVHSPQVPSAILTVTRSVPCSSTATSPTATGTSSLTPSPSPIPTSARYPLLGRSRVVLRRLNVSPMAVPLRPFSRMPPSPEWSTAPSQRSSSTVPGVTSCT